MKTRYSLVSNSSSSSFICYRPIADVALEMWKARVKDWECDGDSYEPYKTLYGDRLKELVTRQDVLNGDTGICFPSCNYDTYIWISGDHCAIETCNNTDWESDVPGLLYVNERDYDTLSSSYFYCVTSPDPIKLTGTNYWSLNAPEKMYCPECQPEKFKGTNKVRSNSSYRVCSDGSYYCSEHYVKLRNIEKDMVIDSGY